MKKKQNNSQKVNEEEEKKFRHLHNMQVRRFTYRIQPHKDLTIGLQVQLSFPDLMSN